MENKDNVEHFKYKYMAIFKRKYNRYIDWTPNGENK